MNDQNASVEQFYAKFWSSADWNGPNPNTDEQLRLKTILEFIRSLPSHSSLNILDIGCGRGWLSSQLGAFGKVLGIDPTSAAVHAARQLFPAIEFAIDTADGLISQGYGGRFDLVVCSEVIEHVRREEQAAFLASIRQLVKPECWALLTTPREEVWEKWLAKGIPLQPVEEWLTEARLRRLAISAGFDIARAERIGFDYVTSVPLRIARRLRRLPGIFVLTQSLVRANAIYQVLLLQRR